MTCNTSENVQTEMTITIGQIQNDIYKLDQIISSKTESKLILMINYYFIIKYKMNEVKSHRLKFVKNHSLKIYWTFYSKDRLKNRYNITYKKKKKTSTSR